jgi:hypothetical protein
LRLLLKSCPATRHWPDFGSDAVVSALVAGAIISAPIKNATFVNCVLRFWIQFIRTFSFVPTKFVHRISKMRTTHERYLCKRVGSDASTIRDAETSVGDSGILVVEGFRASRCGLPLQPASGVKRPPAASRFKT